MEEVVSAMWGFFAKDVDVESCRKQLLAPSRAANSQPPPILPRRLASVMSVPERHLTEQIFQMGISVGVIHEVIQRGGNWAERSNHLIEVLTEAVEDTLFVGYHDAIEDICTPMQYQELLTKYREVMRPIAEVVYASENGARIPVQLNMLNALLNNLRVPHKVRVAIGNGMAACVVRFIQQWCVYGVLLGLKNDPLHAYFINFDQNSKSGYALNPEFIPFGWPVSLGELVYTCGIERQRLTAQNIIVSHEDEKKVLELFYFSVGDDCAYSEDDLWTDAVSCDGGEDGDEHVLVRDGEINASVLEQRVLGALREWSSRLWRRVKRDDRLPEVLNNLRELYLCQSGSIWHGFTERAFTTLTTGIIAKDTPLATRAKSSCMVTTFRHGISTAFMHALDIAGLDGSKFYQKFTMVFEKEEHLRVEPSNITQGGALILARITGLRLCGTLSDGVKLVVSDSAVELYEALFSLEAKLKFALTALAICRRWCSEVQRAGQPSPRLNRICAFLHLLHFTVTAYNAYLQLDVMEPQAQWFSHRLEKEVHSVSDARKAHNSYLRHVAEGAYLQSKVLQDSVDTLCTLCFSLYCFTERFSVSDVSSGGSAAMNPIVSMHGLFAEKVVGGLYRAVQQEGSLWLRLDYNGFFTRVAQGSRSAFGDVAQSSAGRSVEEKRTKQALSSSTAGASRAEQSAAASNKIPLSAKTAPSASQVPAAKSRGGDVISSSHAGAAPAPGAGSLPAATSTLARSITPTPAATASVDAEGGKEGEETSTRSFIPYASNPSLALARAKQLARAARGSGEGAGDTP